MLLTRQDLDRAVCGQANCTHEQHDVLFIHGQCHIESPVEVFYDKSVGTLCVRCFKCKNPIVAIAVAETLPKPKLTIVPKT